MKLNEYEEAGTSLGHMQCNICGQRKVGEFHHFKHELNGGMLWVCRQCHRILRGLKQARVLIKPVETMDREELQDEIRRLLRSGLNWEIMSDHDLQQMVRKLREAINYAIQEAESELPNLKDVSDLGLVSDEAIIIRWKQLTKHLVRLPETTKYAVADAIIRDLGGIPGPRPKQQEEEQP